ncbi:MAG TPA: DUF1634 domain-containing protein [Candidatus Deferrimicrobium sp.]|nr:DUF1634 domain-containing protein [Candidatus Deferrimicrobium sp.]
MTAARFNAMVSTVLLVGVLASAALIAIGLAGALAVGWDGSMRGVPATDAASTDFSAMLDGLIALRPIAFAQAGLLVLLATPVMRVVASIVGFGLEGDRLFTVITITVLAILLLSLFVLR